MQRRQCHVRVGKGENHQGREVENRRGANAPPLISSVSQMTEDQKIILEKIIACGGRVDTKTFRGSGQIVAGMIRRGWVEWERGNMPRTLNATALLITDLGKLAAKSVVTVKRG